LFKSSCFERGQDTGQGDGGSGLNVIIETSDFVPI
jgi:hypothetical protein